jgi:hypothetical protein
MPEVRSTELREFAFNGTGHAIGCGQDSMIRRYAA